MDNLNWPIYRGGGTSSLLVEVLERELLQPPPLPPFLRAATLIGQRWPQKAGSLV